MLLWSLNLDGLGVIIGALVARSFAIATNRRSERVAPSARTFTLLAPELP